MDGRIDPGSGPQDLPFTERVLYHIVDLSDNLPSTQGYGVLEAQVAAALSDELGVQRPTAGRTLAEYQESLDPRALARLREAATDLQARLLVEVYDDPERGLMLTPTRPGQQRVREWQRWWPQQVGSTPASAANLPTGIVTFLFTDIEGSTRLWEHQPDLMREALSRHNRILRDMVQSHGGVVFKVVGDGFYTAFSRPLDALYAATDAQRALLNESWDPNCVIGVRMALHTGPAEAEDNDYHGQAVNQASRLVSIGHAGQVLLSQPTQLLVRGVLPAGTELRDLGEYHLRDLIHSERMFEVRTAGLPSDFPALNAGSEMGVTASSPDRGKAPEARDFDNPWVPKILSAFAELQQRDARSRSLGVTFHHLLMHLQVPQDTDEFIGVQDAMGELIAGHLVEESGSYLRLSSRGWEMSVGHVPGAERDDEFLRAAVSAWRDPNFKRAHPNWLAGTAIYDRLNWSENIFEMTDRGRRLRDRGLIELYDEMNQEIFVRPTYRALQEF